MAVTANAKTCTRCNETKPLQAFSKHSTCRMGRHSQCKQCVNTAFRRRYAGNEELREACRRRQYKSRYGLTYEEYERLLAKAECGVCGATSSARGKLCVDHDHVSGRVRGFLCTECNLAIGYLKDDPALMRRAIEYLEGAV